MSRTTESRTGFTLVELAVVIVIIGVLAAFGVPQFLKSVERSKAAEAFNYLSAVRSAQERFLAKNGSYWAGTIASDGTVANVSASGGMPASITDQLDINQTPPKYFSGDGTVGKKITVTVLKGAVVGTAASHWESTLTRIGASSSYGKYTVIYDEAGYVPRADATVTRTSSVGGTNSSIDNEVNPMGQ